VPAPRRHHRFGHALTVVAPRARRSHFPTYCFFECPARSADGTGRVWCCALRNAPDPA
jgi:hypothetical protein